MKTKLSFLALPLCLGLILTFVLAACSGGKNDDEPSTSSNSGAPFMPSSEVQSENILFESLDLNKQGDKIRLSGTITAQGGVNSIAKLTFTTGGSGWVSYDGKPVTAPLTNLPKTIVLNSERAEIDLTNTSIPCSTHGISVEACACAAGGSCCTSKNSSFEKPQSYCVSSSSATPSSSSKAMWKFGTMESITVSKDVNNAIGSGSLRFKLIEYESDGMDEYAVTVEGGNIQELPTTPSIWDTDDGYPQPGVGYESSYIGNPGPTKTRVDNIIRKDYYLLSSGSQKYFIQFDAAGEWSDWPKRARYWIVTESP